jgi:hypothetical protein
VLLLLAGILLGFAAALREVYLPPDTSVLDERRMAYGVAAREALEALPAIAKELGTDRHLVEQLRHEYEAHLETSQRTKSPTKNATQEHNRSNRKRRCDSRCWSTSGLQFSAPLINNAPTTPSCVRSRHDSTSKSSGFVRSHPLHTDDRIRNRQKYGVRSAT